MASKFSEQTARENRRPLMILYIAGPMTGYPDFNYPAFHDAERRLRAAGFEVLNPADRPEPKPDPSWEDWLRGAITIMLRADGVAFLGGAGGSRGARLEVRLARDLAMPVRSVRGWLTQARNDAYMERIRS